MQMKRLMTSFRYDMQTNMFKFVNKPVLYMNTTLENIQLIFECKP